MDKRTEKSVKESLVIKNELLLPNDTNPLNNLMGGRLMHWMDIAAGISAMKHANCFIVTASVDNISFSEPIGLGCIVTLEAQVTRAFNTSMEVYIEVWAENIPAKKRFKSNSAFFTFVAVDKKGKPVKISKAIPETEKEQALYEGALRRRQLRLVLAGRMKPDEATELKSIFDQMNEQSGENGWLKHFITEDLFVVEKSLGTPKVEDLREKPKLKINEPPPINNIVVIVANDPSKVIGKDSMVFLEKVLGAVGLKIKDITIIDTFKEPDRLREVSPDRCEKMILFHPTLCLEGFEEKTLYKVLKRPACSILRADFLPEIEADTSKKRALWSALQSMFEIT